MKDFLNRYFQRENSTIAWFLFFFGITIIFYIFGTGCKTNPPAIDVTFWAGDSSKTGVTRAQDNQTLSCGSASFDDYACLTYEDIRKIWDALLLCEKWPAQTVSSPSNLQELT